jgi:sodium-coupled neutral amino acid transporter 11
LQDVGSVLAFTGAIAGSCLSYIGPGVAYLAVHGNEFLELVETSWGFKLTPSIDGGTDKSAPSRRDIEVANTGVEIESAVTDTPETGYLMMGLKTVAWYTLCMPFWCSVATFGKKTLMAFSRAESTKSPHPNPLGNVLHNRLSSDMNEAGASGSLDGVKHSTSEGNLAAAAMIHKVASGNDVKTLPKKNITVSGYGAVEGTGGNRGIAAAIAAKNKQAAKPASWQVDMEEDPQHDPPAPLDFLIAIGFILFGVVALCAGLVSIYYQ